MACFDRGQTPFGKNFHQTAAILPALGLGRVKTPTFNLRVEIPSRFRKFENQKCLRPPLREDDRENNSAHSWLVHVFTQPGPRGSAAAARTARSEFDRDNAPAADRSSCQHVAAMPMLCSAGRKTGAAGKFVTQ